MRVAKPRYGKCAKKVKFYTDFDNYDEVALSGGIILFRVKI